jgi:Domain of unknown function (DUF6250)
MIKLSPRNMGVPPMRAIQSTKNRFGTRPARVVASPARAGRPCYEWLPGLLLILTCAPLLRAVPTTIPSDPRFTITEQVDADYFTRGLDRWITELEKSGNITARDGTLDIDVPAGASIWFKTKLTGPLMIQYDVTPIVNGGPDDRLSDVNCFWMATDARNKDDFFAVPRTGKFADYNQLLTYYVGLGGNTNRTTRFRRYVGDTIDRPLLPQNDLRDPADLLKPNQEMLIQLIAADHLIQFYRDGKKLFEMDDPQPYTAGYFAFRTTKSHLRVRDFAVYRLQLNSH